MKVTNTVLPAHTYSPEKSLRENFNSSFEAYVNSFQNKNTETTPTSEEVKEAVPAENSQVTVMLPDGSEGTANLLDTDDFKLIIPNKENMERMMDMTQRLLSEIQMMANISLPESISYDQNGEIVLPQDYPFKEEFIQALEEHPIAGNMLQTTYAISTHYAALEERKPMIEELQEAATQAQIDAIIHKYSKFLDDNYQGPATSLTISSNGNMGLKAGDTILL